MRLTVSTEVKRQVLDITDQLNDLVARTGVTEGICAAGVLHTTCSLATADLDPGTDMDFLDFLMALIPKGVSFRHPHDPKHAPEHLLSSLIGTSVTAPISEGQLQLGTWQRVVLVELSGPRRREVVVKVVAGKD